MSVSRKDKFAFHRRQTKLERYLVKSQKAKIKELEEENKKLNKRIKELERC